MSHNRKKPRRAPKTPQYESDKDRHKNPKSRFYVPNDPDNRPSADPEQARTEGPDYTINAESLCFSDSLGRRPPLDPLKGTLHLVAKMQEDGFHLEPICRSCESWIPARVIKPARKGVIDASRSCFGCVYGHLDGTKAEYALTNRDAAFSAWAGAKRDVTNLEYQRSQALGQRKESLTRRLEKAHQRVKRAYLRCKRLGFSPTLPKQGQSDWVRPLLPQTRDQRRKSTEADLRDRAPSPSCRNCWNWDIDDALSRGDGTLSSASRGHCYLKDGETTKASYWCADHGLKTEG